MMAVGQDERLRADLMLDRTPATCSQDRPGRPRIAVVGAPGHGWRMPRMKTTNGKRPIKRINVVPKVDDSVVVYTRAGIEARADAVAKDLGVDREKASGVALLRRLLVEEVVFDSGNPHRGLPKDLHPKA